MALECGIVGLPNVGKSTIFSALTAAPAAAENFPFCTIDPNIGIVDLKPQVFPASFAAMSSAFIPSQSLEIAFKFPLQPPSKLMFEIVPSSFFVK